ncbi:MAG: nucleotidyltransferase domain-containing protein [Nitrososphaerota archaeon]|nr:nucleotidyltransferase domain-containing protein [Nitrososphaerota archaeon]
MRKLDASEKEKISKTIAPLLKKRELVALCAYGSQVAGYATEGSDYDVIVVTKPFSQRIKYYYLKDEVECAALLVDPKSFENDCNKSSLGEFVSGRLLNVHEPLQGSAFLKRNEIAYKKHVILEALSEAYAEYMEFTTAISFPLSYFLFEKLRKRAAIYPPVVYSYARTYSEELLNENLGQSLEGFRDAAKELVKEGVIELQEDLVSVSPQAFRGGLSARIGAAASFTNKSLRQYAIHGYAGRVRPEVVGKEVLSKISRSKKAGKLPEHISNPKKDWSIGSGRLFVASDDWLTDLATSLQLEQLTLDISSGALGEFYNSASFYTLKDASKSHTIAVKRFNDIKGMKWGVLSLWSLRAANFTANPMQRLFREYKAKQEFAKFGLSTPRVLAIFLSQRMMVTDFIHGIDLSRIETNYLDGVSEECGPITRFGHELALLHNNNYCMGDTKPSNAILAEGDGKIYFTDLEQAVPGGNKVWDVAEFIYYSVRFTLKEERARKLVRAFAEGYSERAEDKTVLRRAYGLRYRAPFQAFVAPNILSALRRDLEL